MKRKILFLGVAEGSAVQQTRPGNVFDDNWKDKFPRQGTAASPQRALAVP